MMVVVVRVYLSFHIFFHTSLSIDFHIIPFLLHYHHDIMGRAATQPDSEFNLEIDLSSFFLSSLFTVFFRYLYPSHVYTPSSTFHLEMNKTPRTSTETFDKVPFAIEIMSRQYLNMIVHSNILNSKHYTSIILIVFFNLV